MLAFVLVAVVIPLVLSELTDWAPRFAERVLALAARFVHVEARDEQLRHWQGELDMIPARWSKLVWSIGILVRSRSISAATEALGERRHCGGGGAEDVASEPVAEPAPAAFDIVVTQAASTASDGLGEIVVRFGVHYGSSPTRRGLSPHLQDRVAFWARFLVLWARKGAQKGGGGPS